MGVPCAPVRWFVMYDDFGAWGGHWHLIEIKWAVELGLCIYPGVDTVLAKNI